MTAQHPPTSSDDTKRKIDLNPIRVAAAALAAVTAAVLGSKLGAAGTLIGAAGASVMTTVGTAVYQASLERSRESVRSMAHRNRPLPTCPQAGDRSRQFATLRWGAVIVGTLGAFLLAMMFITGFEWASGQTVGGNKGTTIGRVINDQPRPHKPPTSPSPPGAPASETPIPTPTETPTTPEPGTLSPDQDPNEEPSAPETPSQVKPTPTLIPPLLPGLDR